ncbi:MAG: hypothetical protein CVV44_11770 [Spirochaetae bacterium HGW-Spirochaetae-1]|nr:MAG: hypothetical protein CVV44_11770 [Spirochaetae bacterium HGW-Spirochaetae-1]
MPRIRLDEQSCYEFTHEMDVRASDINMGGHLGHTELINYIHEARALMFETFNVHERDLGDGCTGIVIGDLAVNYRSEVFWGDKLIINSSIGEISGKSFRIFHRITCRGALVALVETGIIAFSVTERKALPLPAVFLEKLHTLSACV